MIDEKQLEKAARQLDSIRRAREVLAQAEADLKMFNDLHAKGEWKPNASFKPQLLLKKGDGYAGTRDRTVTVMIPVGFVQQQLVYAVARAQRALISVGGTL